MPSFHPEDPTKHLIDLRVLRTTSCIKRADLIDRMNVIQVTILNLYGEGQKQAGLVSVKMKRLGGPQKLLLGCLIMTRSDRRPTLGEAIHICIIEC